MSIEFLRLIILLITLKEFGNILLRLNRITAFKTLKNQF